MENTRTSRSAGLILALILGLGGDALAVEGEKRVQDRTEAQLLMNSGNWKEAYAVYSELAADPDDEPGIVSQDFALAVQCLNNLGNLVEFDAFAEKVIAAHPKNPTLLQVAATQYMQQQHQGNIVAGAFERGYHRGGTARFVDSFERDRTRALQLLDQGRPLLEDAPAGEAAGYLLYFSQVLNQSRFGVESWRLQYATDLTKLPDYEEYRYDYYGNQSRGAPVDEKGEPVYHKLPASWEEAATDGERWRWCLIEAAERDASMAPVLRKQFADFLHAQFGVQTMASWGHFFGRMADDEKKDSSGPYELTSLKDDETIARLASGIRRFTLPQEYDFIGIYRELAEAGDMDSTRALAQIYEDRQQYPTAATWWRKCGEDSRVTQITGNWGTFESAPSLPAGRKAALPFRFRNGSKVTFTAHEILVDKLIEAVKKYLKSGRRDIEHDKIDVASIGNRLAQGEAGKFRGAEVARWTEDLSPRPDHFDRRVTVTTPLEKSGAFLLTSEMEGGNKSHIVVWISDLVLVKKMLDNEQMYFVADSVTGAPAANVPVELFGYQQQYRNKSNGEGYYEILTTSLTRTTNADGQAFFAESDAPSGYQWLVSARDGASRHGWLGWTYFGYTGIYDQDYNQVKTFVMTDRPVYRPGQKVHTKFWVNNARYDQEGQSAYAGTSVQVRIVTPKSEAIEIGQRTLDAYGGAEGEWEIPKDATLGTYQVQVPNHGSGTFRIEEYKKPEFEVTVEAPTEPVMLGEKIEAKVQAKYLFGAPVTEGKIKYKVTRANHSGDWYPAAPWDWYYGEGYWWFACDYLWYPGWHLWGCRRPVPLWTWGGHWAPPQQPEIVAENETEIGADGTVAVEIDTALAKAVMGDIDHRYEITAEVTDQSRRTITGTGTVLVARRPFKTYVWVDRGHFRVGETIQASFSAQRLDQKPVSGKGVLRLMKVTYGADQKPVETEVQKWDLDTGVDGRARQQLSASEAGQFRLSYTVTDSKGHAIEGGYVFVVSGEGFDGSAFRFNDLELIPEKREYAPGEKVKLRISTAREDSTVLLFVRPTNGVALRPLTRRLKGKSLEEEIEVLKKDMPNFFVEALTVSGGEVHQEMREIVVPPEERIYDVTVVTPKEKVKPGEKTQVEVRLTDPSGEPVAGSVVVTMYDKAVEYISGGSNVGDIREFFWKWRRSHQPGSESSLDRSGYAMSPPNDPGMQYLGAFGHLVAQADPTATRKDAPGGAPVGALMESGAMMDMAPEAEGKAAAAPMAPGPSSRASARNEFAGGGGAKMQLAMGIPGPGLPANGGGSPPPAMVEPTIRKDFQDTAFWSGSLTAGKDGIVRFDVTMPENLTTWKTKVWVMGEGTRVGQGETQVITAKNLILRLQAPRFFVEKDEVVLSANVHNYLDAVKPVKVSLELEGGCLELMDGGGAPTQEVFIDSMGEKRVDWRVRVLKEGKATVRMKALSDEESDAMQMEFPAHVHGMLKTESFCGVIRPDASEGAVDFTVPAERKPEQSRLEIRYSPTLAGAMVDALPYLVEFPYGCTEQTLNKFLPTVITQNVLKKTGISLDDIQKKITNLNAQEIGDDVKRSQDWERLAGTMRWDGSSWVKRNPVFDTKEVEDMVRSGLGRLLSMQVSDGGWGWFSGYGEQSYPHTTALVVHGLQIARSNGVAVDAGAIARGIQWLEAYRQEEKRRLHLPEKDIHRKTQADALDALVGMVLADENSRDAEMNDLLYRDRNHLPVYAKCMFGLTMQKVGDTQKRDMVMRNIEQFLVEDAENQTAYLKLPEDNWWWYWYGSEYEAQAYYLKLLAAVDPGGEKASRLVKYLLNNRRNSTYWNSTRDTAVVVEAFADYIVSSGEDKPDMTVEVVVDGTVMKTVKIDGSNLFSYDNKLVLTGDQVTAGAHKVELRKKGTGPLYWNVYSTNFTLEEYITKAGLEIKVERACYKLIREDATRKAAGDRGQALDQKVEKYRREPIQDLATLKSGELVEIELVVESKNDYEYILLEDMKAAGFEPVEVRSGYNGNDMGAYVEFRDERVTFFVRALARGKHSVSYRLRSEIPGKFSALPARASAMYAPELKANSDEIKLIIQD